jgi:hypothetical protein
MSLRKLAVIGLFAVVACSAEAQVSRVFVSVSGNAESPRWTPRAR